MMNRLGQRRPCVLSLCLLALACTALTIGPAQAGSVRTGTAGCGQQPPARPGSDIDGHLTVSGKNRTYRLHVPKGYRAATPTMLVYNFPGTGYTGASHEKLTLMSGAADRMNYIVVYPNALAHPLTMWNVTSSSDVQFIDALNSRLETQLCVDTTRIDATGLSIGALFAYHLACSNTPWLTAIAPVAGTLPYFVTRCHVAHHTPLLAFNGQKDPLVPYNLAALTVKTWASVDHCSTTSKPHFQKEDETQIVYGCSGSMSVSLYTCSDCGHQWPGPKNINLTSLGKNTNAINATQLISQFFKQHPRS